MLRQPYLIMGALLAVAVLIAVRNIRVSGPYSLTRVLPWRVSRRPVVVWRDGPFLGWGRSILGQTRWAFGSPEDTVAIVGPPRISGKTAGLIIPQAAMFNGALVTTSTKPDVLRATIGRRWELARQHGGSVHVYMPTADGAVEGLTPIRWSPLAGCQDPLVSAMRVDALVSVAEVGKNVENADHWRAGAARLLRPYFLAAAHHPTLPGDMSVVARWLSLHEFREPLAILADLHVDGAQQWAADLVGLAERTNDKERSSFFAAAATALKATAVPAVLRSCSGTDIDPEEFIRTRSTLYIISPSEYQAPLAPIIAAFVESLVHAAYKLHDAHGHRTDGGLRRLPETLWRFVTGQEPQQDGRPPRLFLQLDELTNIAPLPSLESIISQGAGRGVPVCWTVQSLAQLRGRYGDHAAEAIWSASTCKVVFGGLSDGPTLDHISRLIGDHRVPTRTVSTDREGKRNETRGFEWRPRLAPSQLRELRRGWALLLYHHRPPRALRAPIAAKRWRMRGAVTAWSGIAIPRPATTAAPAQPVQPAAWPELRPHVVHAEPPATTVTTANGGMEAETTANGRTEAEG
jgi:type IV secretory pathway TraG/TraD family ATPase VirD4